MVPVQLGNGQTRLGPTQILSSRVAPVHGAQTTIHAPGVKWYSRTLGSRVYVPSTPRLPYLVLTMAPGPKGPAVPYVNQYLGVDNTTGIATAVDNQLQAEFVAPPLAFVCNHVLRFLASN